MSERKLIIKHALTVLVGQLAVVSFGVADTVIAGRFDPQALAVLSVSAAIYVTVYVALLGILQALLPMFAELHGAKQHQQIGAVFRQGIYLWVGLSVLGVLLLMAPEFLLGWTGVPTHLQDQSITYLAILGLALPPALFFRLFSTLSQSLGKPKLVTAIQLIALILKIPLSIAFTFGFANWPAMGLTGCALATVLVNISMMAIAFWILKDNNTYTDCRIWSSIEAPSAKELLKMCRLGLPNGLSVTVEVTSFTLMALLISRLGITASASHQVASNMAALLYMVPLSFSIAISARISYWKGAGQQLQMKQTMHIGFQITMFLALCLSTLLWLFHQPIANIYAKDAAVADMAGQLLILIGFYHLVDALQTLCFFVLRSFKVTLAPAFVYSTVLWGVGLVGGFQLAYEGLGPVDAMPTPGAFWLMNIVGLVFVSACLLWLIQYHLKQNNQAESRI
jgi:MATE family multidrug resistance protein